MNIKITFVSVLLAISVLNAYARRPNIILIMADDFGYECLGCNGSAEYRTPVLDNMAQEGVRFEHCYAQPLCTPTRVKLMTGIYNVRNYIEFGKLDRTQRTFAHILKESGYRTCIAGKWQLGHEPDSARHFGFDESCLWQHVDSGRDKKGHDGRYANPILCTCGIVKEQHNEGKYGPDLTSDFICDFMEKNKSGPFFVYYPMILTHCPFTATPDSSDWQAQQSRIISTAGVSTRCWRESPMNRANGSISGTHATAVSKSQRNLPATSAINSTGRGSSLMSKKMFSRRIR